MSAILYKKSNGPASDDTALVQARANLSLAGTEPEAATIAPGPSHQIFTVTFDYFQQAHELKVLKVSRGYARPIYKIVLSSAMKTNGWMCWLQQRSKTWKLVLGTGIDEKLIAAIGLAIEGRHKRNA